MKVFKRILLVSMALCLGGFIGDTISRHCVTPASDDDINNDAGINITIKFHEDPVAIIDQSFYYPVTETTTNHEILAMTEKATSDNVLEGQPFSFIKFSISLSNLNNNLWTIDQATEYVGLPFTANDWAAYTTMLKSDDLPLKQSFDNENFENYLNKRAVDTYDNRRTDPVSGQVFYLYNWYYPEKANDTRAKITYKMADGSAVPADKIPENPRIVTGVSGDTYTDTNHYLIPEIDGYKASTDNFTFDNQAKLDVKGDQDITITYTKIPSSHNTAEPGEPDVATPDPFKVYGKRGLYRYQNPDFNKSERLQGYAQKSKTYAPIFTVIKTVKNKAGLARYQLSDGSYITANPDYVAKLYWQGAHYQTLYVTNPRGVTAHQATTFTDKLGHYKQGSAITVIKRVRQGQMTRYQLADGTYITGNKQWVSPNRPRLVTRVKTKAKVAVYRNTDLKQIRTHYAKNRIITVKGWDDTNGDRSAKPGQKLYRVSGGYILANARDLKVIK
ncbi:DUF5776 domain-containing protein [Levilactobacillus tangyuanensis]|uniref:DUF5776 domain-containing protein n=1 Tax=Levilactobacillus tangyuanensis TaxID=2486021 RepID=A0ABW1TL68_9LACO|nr:DUF5776 domain-containing protein [Levilactobacillus tangyuanensis]